MDAFLTLLPKERRQICLVAAEQLNLNPGSVEKDCVYHSRVAKTATSAKAKPVK